jgi:iron complex transport system ATP-binding protein
VSELGDTAKAPRRAAAAPAIRMRAATVWRWVPAESRRAVLLNRVDWEVQPGEHWVVLGPNGAGKTTLLNMAAAMSHPSEGAVEVLGERLGRVDVRRLRERIGTVEPELARRLRGRMSARQIVLTGAFGSIGLQPDRIAEEHRRRAESLLETVGAAEIAERRYEDCSQGERQRLLLARALMDEPELLLLDEPTTGLDLPSRERLIASLDALAAANPALPSVTVTHHPEEVPSCATHTLLLAGGRALAAGPIAATLTGPALSECFGIAVEVGHANGRWTATAKR